MYRFVNGSASAPKQSNNQQQKRANAFRWSFQCSKADATAEVYASASGTTYGFYHSEQSNRIEEFYKTCNEGGQPATLTLPQTTAGDKKVWTHEL